MFIIGTGEMATYRMSKSFSDIRPSIYTLVFNLREIGNDQCAEKIRAGHFLLFDIG